MKTRYSRHDSAKTFFRRRCLRPEGEGLSRDPASLHPHSPEITTFPVLSSNKFVLDIYKYWKEKGGKEENAKQIYIYRLSDSIIFKRFNISLGRINLFDLNKQPNFRLKMTHERELTTRET